MVSGTSSPTGKVAEEYALPRRREVPPPTRHETLDLFEEED